MIEFKLFQEFPELFYTFSTSKDGNMGFQYGPEEDVRNNRRGFLEKIEVEPENGVVMKCQDGTKIAIVGGRERGLGVLQSGQGIPVDAMITETPGLYLLLQLADCLPIILYAPYRQVVALVHAGRQATDAQILPMTIEMMVERFDLEANDLVAAIGPGIQKESYKFDHVEQSQKPEWQKYIARDGGMLSVDIVGYNRDQLIRAGVKPECIEISPIDTARSSEYYSHYRSKHNDEPEARFLAIVGMR